VQLAEREAVRHTRFAFRVAAGHDVRSFEQFVLAKTGRSHNAQHVTAASGIARWKPAELCALECVPLRMAAVAAAVQAIENHHHQDEPDEVAAAVRRVKKIANQLHELWD
jgi:hypothetical protein